MDAVSSSSLGLRRWHRRIAWVALLATFCFALTGSLHPLMTRLQPKPAQFKPPEQALPAEALPPPAAALAAAGIPDLAGLRLVGDGSRWLWRVQPPDGPLRYLDARSGKLLPAETEREQAERLARWYTGEIQAAIVQAEPVTAFDAEYAYVNRLLPVWRLRFDRPDGLVAYVSTEEDRLASISDHRKRAFQTLFRALHSWAWLPAPARNGWINLLLAGVTLTVLAGLVLAFRSPGGRRWNLRRGHRWGGIAASLAVLSWVGSGYVQARGNAERERDQAPQRPLALAASVLTAPVRAPPQAKAGARLVSLDGQAAWRWPLQATEPTTGRGLAMGEHQRHGQTPAGAAAPSSALYLSAQDGELLANGEQRHLGELARYFGVAVAPQAATPVTAFSEDYGFLFKRLPVWKLAQADAEHTAYFIDTGSERLAARITDRDRFTGALFAYAHKWEWVTPLAGKDWRDGISAGFALLLLGVATGGTLLRRRSRARR